MDQKHHLCFIKLVFGNKESNWVNLETEIEGFAVSYFNDLFSSSSTSKADCF